MARSNSTMFASAIRIIRTKSLSKDFSAHIKPGQKVAIVGPTGAGKTTMVNLLMRFFDLVGGDIRIDGISTSDLTRENIHELFGMVLQDTWLFDGTVRENLVYNKTGVTDEELLKRPAVRVGSITLSRRFRMALIPCLEKMWSFPQGKSSSLPLLVP